MLAHANVHTYLFSLLPMATHTQCPDCMDLLEGHYLSMQPYVHMFCHVITCMYMYHKYHLYL